MQGKTNLKKAQVVSVFLLVVLGISGYCEAQEAFIVADINPGAVGSRPEELTNVSGTLLFRANDGTHGHELWKSDGTSIGTVMVMDINPSGGLGPLGLTNVNGTLFFTADDGTHEHELWKSDGTEAGTVMVKDIYPGAGSSSLSSPTNVNGTLFFRADDGTNGRELWKSDGTEAGTVMVMNINPSGDSRPEWLTNVNGTLFFRADNGAYGEELWKSNGTSIGTVMVKDIYPSGSSSPGYLTNVNGTLFFYADDGTNGRELWKSDGTSIGTAMVADINPSGNSSPGYLTNVNGTLFFSAYNGTYGSELWKSDGTSIGTVMVKDINPGAGGSGPEYLTNVNGTLFFSADDGTYGGELWKSDGTSIGTVMVKDIYPGGVWSNLFHLTNVNGTLFFRADDGTYGWELWKSNGTEAGTVMVADINPGAVGSSPGYLTNVNSTLFFMANNGSHGQELWAYIHSNRIFVDAAASGANNGSSWADAYLYLQDALTRAVSGNEIFVAQGTYKPDQGGGKTPGDRTARFELINGAAIYGGFPSGGGDWSERDPIAYETILSGDLNGDDGPDFANNGENSYHVVTGSGTNPNTILDGFTITAGNATNGSFPFNVGGGMFNEESSAIVTNCIFSRNRAGNRGGGMCNFENSSPTVTNCTFTGNSASPYGGGMSNYNSSPAVTNCTFSGNSAGYGGGGMFNENSSSPMVTNCTFSGNSTTNYGGGMENDDHSSPTVTNCTFNGNSANNGGGMGNKYYSSPTVTGCILWGNTATVSGAQIYNDGASSAMVNYSDIEGGWAGTRNISDDPLFADADGPDNIIGTADDNLRLSRLSPCIDAGDNTAVRADITTDLGGAPRTAGGSVDMGAYEWDSPVAHWKLDEIAGNIAYDSSGNSHHGTAQSDPTRVDGPPGYGRAMYFDGNDPAPAWVNCGTWNPSAQTGQLTVAVWIRWDGPKPGVWQGVIGKRDGWDAQGTQMMWQLEINKDWHDISFARGGSYPWCGGIVLPEGEWSHVAATFDGSTLIFYVDGQETGRGDFSFGAKTDSTIIIGADVLDGYNGFNGALDDVRLYNYALSGDEVRWLLCARPPRGDLNRDCRVDFVDFAILASSWLDCGLMVQELCGQ